jgi:hypothetical protein
VPEPGAAPGFSVEQSANRSVQNVQTACQRDPSGKAFSKTTSGAKLGLCARACARGGYRFAVQAH